MKHSKKSILALAMVVIIIVSLVGCANTSSDDSTDANETTKPTTSTTITTTTTTTTENMDTTFAESSTRQVYPALKKDKEGSYPYKLAEYSTYYDASNETRSSNMAKAVSRINNLRLAKGATFSFNQTVGKRTITSGYKEAHVIANGELTDGLGGGICQVSSTIFEAVLRANLEIVSRTNHSLSIAYVPAGGDATVDWNSKDFQFRNSLNSDIRLKMVCSGGKITCTVYAKKNVKVGDVKIKIEQEGEDDYVLTRTVNGKKNYETKSHYQKPKPTTTESTTKDKKSTTTKKR